MLRKLLIYICVNEYLCLNEYNNCSKTDAQKACIFFCLGCQLTVKFSISHFASPKR